MATTILWFRRDLRLSDHAAVHAALQGAAAVVPTFVRRDVENEHGPGAASHAWLERSLAELDADLRRRGSGLVIRPGTPAEALTRLAQECGASRVCCQRDWTPMGLAEEAAVREMLAAGGVALDVSEGQLLVTPTELLTGDGGPYRVFTPFFHAWSRAWQRSAPLPAPNGLPRPALMPASAGPHAAAVGAPDVARWWRVGEAAASERLAEFVRDALSDYETDRDRPDLRGTSELSPRLAWGELSARQVALAAYETAGEAAEPFVRQLAWREFAYHVLYHFPRTLTEPLRSEFSQFAWCDDTEAFSAWKRGQTGYPLVDAGMRQLAATGWMHNRVRLVCGSFLTKDLLGRWQDGEAYFRERLVDFDVAANTFNWQWIAGCGADAAPYFRVFNPALQGTRFDPDGSYVRTWVPELAGLDTRWIHVPHQAPAEELERAGVTLGAGGYPRPIIDHAEARLRALAAFAALRDAPPPLG